VTILILQHACLFHASSSKPTVNEALDYAYSQYQASNTHNTAIRKFVAPSEKYSVLQITEFILNHQL
jgi:hypothetical protein